MTSRHNSGLARWLPSRPRAGLLIAGVVAAAVLTPVASGANTWGGFSVSTLPSAVLNGTSPAWGLGVTEDLGGPGVDIWNNNHGNLSEALVDLGTPNLEIRTAASYGATQTVGPDSHGVAFSDIDGDGDEDLFEQNGRNNPNRLFRNDGGELTLVDEGGLSDPFGRGRQPIFFDFDNDGDMDALLTNLDLRSDPVPQNERQLIPSEVWLNNGDGTQWTRVPDPNQVITDSHVRIAQLTSTSPGSDNIIVTHDVFTIAEDSAAVGTGQLQVPANPAIRRTNTSLPIREVIVGDFDNDLHPEFIAFHGSTAQSGGGWPIVAYEVSDAGNDRNVSIPRSADLDNCRSGAAADFDNDGDLDILAGCAQREEGQDRNVLLLNDGRGNFVDAGTGAFPATIAETPGAIVVADVDGNGWVDAVIASGYDFDRAPDQLALNQGGDDHWLRIDLEGSNPDAIGAQVFVGTESWQVRESGHRYHRSQDERTLHFGLGDATRVAPLEIRWPDGTFERCSVSGVDRTVRIVQGGTGCIPQTASGLVAAIGSDPVVVEVLEAVEDAPPQDSADRCNGQAPTVNGLIGTNGDDVIIGTNGNDVIIAGDGNDLICGGAGSDTINAGNGADTVFGGPGDDIINLGQGRDFADAGAGDDFVSGGKGKDGIFGAAGNDDLRGNEGTDTIEGGDGNDELRGGQKADEIYGGAGDDNLVGGTRPDALDGGPGADTYNGGSGNDACLTDPDGRSEPRVACEISGPSLFGGT